MKDEGNQLLDLLRATRRRRRLMLALRGIAMCLGVGAAILLLAGWAAHRYRYNEVVLIVLRALTLLGFIASVYLLLVRPLFRRIGNAQLARVIEEHHPDLHDRFVAAIEFSAKDQPQRISPAIIDHLVADADQKAATINLDVVIHRRKLWAYGAAATACVLIFVGALRWGPRTLFMGVTQLVTPTSLAASPNALSISVKPGTARVPKNSDQDIIATLVNFDAEAVTFFSRPLNAEGKTESEGAQWVGQVMEPAKAKSDFQFVIFNIQNSTEYFVETNGVRSETFKLDVVDLPFVKQIDLTLNFPAYTHIAAKTIEDGGEIAALKGTVARITARLTGQVKAARIVLRDGRKIEMRAESGTNFTGAVAVMGNTSYHIELVSVDGETYNGSNEHDITMLEDQPPTVTFEKPGRDTRATSIEEVFTQAKAEDDYGVASIELFFSVNGGAEQRVELQKSSRDAGRILNGTHTFFLEEHNLKPGDFVSYYAKARDASSEATSDIYFIEVKPFEMQFRQAQQQGGGGGGEGGEDQNALTRRQKDLIAATFRLIREGTSYTAQERNNAYNTIAQGQERLRDETLAFSSRIRRRLVEGMGEKEILTKLIEHIALAAREMNLALDPLKKQSGKEALPAEQRALQHLLSADAIFREMQVAFGNSENGGGQSQQQAQELSDLFELELDKMKNQYETLRREQRQQSERGKDEVARKLEELARRQQQAVEQQQRRQQGQPLNGSSGGGGSQRQQQELIDETRRAARELERLSRERRDARLEELSRQLNQAADEMQRAQSASSSNNQGESVAQAQRALERLEQARRRLQGTGQASRTQELSELRQRAAEASARQREITKDVESLARQNGQSGQNAAASGAKQQLAERKDALADSLNNLEQNIEQAARALGQQQPRAAQQLRDAAASLRRNRVSERIKQNSRNIENNQYEAARAGERMVQQNLNELSERLQSAEQSAGRSAGSEGEEALDRTRQLADNLESLRRRINENADQRGARSGRSPQSNAQSGQQQQQGDQTSQGESSRGGQQDGQPTGQSGRFSQGGNRQDSSRVWGNPSEGDSRQIGAELRERVREAEDVRRQLGRAGNDLTRGLDEAINQLQRLANNERIQEAQTATLLKAQVIDPLRQIELELSRRLQAKLGHSNLRLGDEGAAPQRYRKSVDEYYRRLSQRALVR